MSLGLTIAIERDRWDNYHQEALIVEMKVRVVNDGSEDLHVSGYSIETNPGTPLPSLEVRREVHSRQKRLAPLPSVIDAGDTASGWFVHAFARPPRGGTPTYVFTLHDAVDNEYSITCPAKEPIKSDFRRGGQDSGTVIILFADIVDSTSLTEKLGDSAFREKASELDEALRSIIRTADGTPVEGKLLGDGVMSTFSAAKSAIDAALRFGEAGESVGLQLHLGIHAGDVIREGDNVFGGAVNIAARISSESEAGEVLVSQTVRDLARTSASVKFEDRGERELKGVGEPVRLYSLGDD